VVSKRLKTRVRPGGTLVLDAQGLSPHVDYDEKMRALIAKAESEGSRVAVSSVNIDRCPHAGSAGRDAVDEAEHVSWMVRIAQPTILSVRYTCPA
jgi:LDH2 family malate/lactate/ureidoglycolate dehydrogenase